MFSPRIGLKPLAALCRRMATSLEAGLDMRGVWKREANAARGAARRAYTEISIAVDSGKSLSEGVRATGTFFPVLFRELVVVGEQSGHQAEVFKQLAENYEHQVTLRRDFISAITWPVIQLCLALGVVGFLIWIMGLLADNSRRNGAQPMDLLGLGLMGTPGLIKYLSFLAAVAAVGMVLFQAIRRGVFWVAPLQRGILYVPKLGRCLDILALSRLAWTMHVTFEAGMPLEKALRLSLASTHNAHYSSLADDMWMSIRRGQDLYEAFAATEKFPVDFLETIQVGEQSGRLVHSLRILSKQYQEEARSALGILTHIAGFAVWCMVAALIIVIIFRIFSVYVGAINDAAKGL